MMQNIYITSDEEIKEGDWALGDFPDNPIGKVISKYGQEFTAQSLNGNKHGLAEYDSKKIILTDNKDLIKDGVQAIDDEFLQWFVKNPSCESVKIESWQTKGEWDLDYKIIIPKEEPKQHVEYINNNIEEFEGKLKEFKQVTSIDWLEKQLDNNDFSNHQMEVNISMSLPKYIEIFKQSKEMYNQERMYSEEDLKQSYSQGWMTRERFDDLSPEIVYPDGLDYEEKQEYAFNLWFNQFKKK
jgi:hypothetical protein